jgi:formate hydrogenlyase subunit 3/multisubunit Na+/H+ antiporter MnhD subunit
LNALPLAQVLHPDEMIVGVFYFLVIQVLVHYYGKASMDLLTQYGLFMAIGVFALGAIISIFFSAKKTEKDAWVAAHIAGAFGGFCGLLFSVLTIISGDTVQIQAIKYLTLHVDGLAAFCIATFSLASLATSIYGITYHHAYTGSYRLGVFGFFYNIFLASIVLLFAATDTVQQFFLILIIAGFFAYAGATPLRRWLAAIPTSLPPHVFALAICALFSIPTYLLVRFFDSHSELQVWWGLTLILFGAFSSLTLALLSLQERDTGRKIIHISILNFGIILIGLGGTVTFFALGATAYGIVALVAALYHAANCSLVVALLYLTYASVTDATKGSEVATHRSGLIQTMPWTSVFFLIGALAVAGLPPMNGFVSIWFTYQGLFAGIALLGVFGKITFLIATLSLAIASTFTAVILVKTFGAIFLTRSHRAGADGAWSMRAALGILATLTIILGAGAGTIAPTLGNIAEKLRGLPPSRFIPPSPLKEVALGQLSALSMAEIVLALGIVFATISTVVYFIFRKQSATIIARSTEDVAPTTHFELELYDTSRIVLTRLTITYRSLPGLYWAYVHLPFTPIIRRAVAEVSKLRFEDSLISRLSIGLTLLLILYFTAT